MECLCDVVVGIVCMYGMVSMICVICMVCMILAVIMYGVDIWYGMYE